MRYRVICEPDLMSGRREVFGPYAGPLAYWKALLIAHCYVARHEWGAASVEEAP